MKYETPELTALTPAVNAIQGSTGSRKVGPGIYDTILVPTGNELASAYEDWE